MADYLEKLGMDFFRESEESVRSLISYVISEGKAIVGYYGHPYINCHFKDAQIIARTKRDDEAKRIEFLGMDTHSAGNCVWEVQIGTMDIDRKDKDILERRCAVRRREDHGGIAVVNIVNADVLPSFEEGENLTLQMVAFPEFIEYFKDEDEYAKSCPEEPNGRKFLLSDGTMMPTGLFRNRSPDSEDFEKDERLDDLMLVRGTVKGLRNGRLAFGDEEHNAYIRCFIDTEFGELEILHTWDDVKEEQRDNVCAGAIVNCLVTLSADAAIYEYEDGVVLDEEHDLKILRATFNGSDAERMRFVFAENVTYVSESSNATFDGRSAVIDRLKYVEETLKDKCFANMATIVSVDDGDERLPYGPGKRCVVLAYGEETNYESIAFADIDEDGRISKMVISTNSRYHFRIDEKPRPKNPLDDVRVPDSVMEPIILRARFHGIIDDDITDEMVLNSLEDAAMYKNNAKCMLEALPADDEENAMANMFGYLFAKAIESEYSEKQNVPGQSRLLVSYSPSDAWNNTISTRLDEKLHKKVEAAMKLGKQFYKDYVFFSERVSETKNDEVLERALVLVQQLGKLYEPRCLRSN